MRRSPFILRCTAFILLLVFSQKAGAGLLLHNLFHTNSAERNIPGHENKDDTNANYNCSCVDDFLMPFAGAEEPIFSQPLSSIEIPFLFFADKIPFHTPVFSFLRGPPAGLL
ncbi:MAG: hypothetical protein ABI688_11780 [Bacteroidota bacterium]